MRTSTRVALLLLSLTAHGLAEDGSEPVRVPNYKQASQYGTENLRPFVYDTAVNPVWIGKTDNFWYAFRTAAGTSYWKVSPKLGTKVPLFDQVKLGMLLSEMVQKPFEPTQLPITRLALNEEGTKLKFAVGSDQYEYDLGAETLSKLGKATAVAPGGTFSGRRGVGVGRRDDGENNRRDDGERDQGEGGNANGTDGAPNSRGPSDRALAPDKQIYVFARKHNLYLGEVAPKPTVTSKSPEAPKTRTDDALKAETKAKAEAEGKAKAEAEGKAKAEAEGKAKAEAEGKAKAEAEGKAKAEAEGKAKAEAEGKAKAEAEGKAKAEAEGKAKAEKTATPDEVKEDEVKKDEAKKDEVKKDGKPKASEDPDKNDVVIALTTDGVEDYSFGGADTAPDKKARPFGVVWSPDSKAFYVTRRDQRSVKELYLVNSLSTPRPTLEKYKYPLPGEDGISIRELYVYSRDKKSFTKVQPKWKEEGYAGLSWGKTGAELRFIRIDRLVRHLEFCALNVATGEVKTLITEGFENAPLSYQSVTNLDDSDEMIWWSERSGWGHYYLHGKDGTLKGPITMGPFRADSIAAVDRKNRMLYFTANGREPNENPNYVHLYRVHFDGTGLELMDPGDANHRSLLSPSRQFLVDNASRVDQIPTATLRGADGRAILELEKADLSKLMATGWKMPETFVVKAADGVTDLYGDLWKPFDFDPKKRYPVIVHVYPGPQQEGTKHTFSAVSSDQTLAQVGFIVIQVGHRGGTPTRSKAYASFGYQNLRDFGLADKKAAVEQLAMRHPFLDINRVGIYGHSGGGFMTAAALLQKPYNDFFKVGVSSSGNHDNNVYGAYWAERYHGLKEVAVNAKKETKTDQVGGAKEVAKTAAVDPDDDQDQDQDQELPVMDGTDDGLAFPADEDKAKADKALADKAKATKDAERAKEEEKATKFEINVPTNTELAANLKGHLLLVHGDMDNNVHPAGTMRLVDALIKANKRFDMLIIPGKRHGYSDAQPYFVQRMTEYFAQHLLDDRQPGADIFEKVGPEENRR